MSNVIHLDGSLSERRAKAFAPGHSAEIVIFHGVRVERLTDDMIQSSATRMRRLPSLQKQATADELE